jgi:hypothetical protein
MDSGSSSSTKRSLPPSPSSSAAIASGEATPTASTDDQPELKKLKLDNAVTPASETPLPVSGAEKPLQSLLPPSTWLFGREKPAEGSAEVTRPPIETDVGILEYIGKDIKPFQGIIKQRYV